MGRYTWAEWEEIEHARVSIKDLDQAAYELEHALRQSLAILPAARPVVLLTGGVDSAVLLALARDEYPDSLLALTVGAPGTNCLARSEQTAEALGVEFSVATLTHRGVARGLGRALDRLGYPGLMTLASAILIETALGEVEDLGKDGLVLANGLDLLYGDARRAFAWEEVLDGLASRHLEQSGLDLYPALARAYGLGIHLPFEDSRVALVARKTDPELFTQGDRDKAVIRHLALGLGVPPTVALARHEPFQRASGILSFLRGVMHERAEAMTPDQDLVRPGPDEDPDLALRLFISLEAARREIIESSIEELAENGIDSSAEGLGSQLARLGGGGPQSIGSATH